MQGVGAGGEDILDEMANGGIPAGPGSTTIAQGGMATRDYPLNGQALSTPASHLRTLFPAFRFFSGRDKGR